MFYRLYKTNTTLYLVVFFLRQVGARLSLQFYILQTPTLRTEPAYMDRNRDGRSVSFFFSPFLERPQTQPVTMQAADGYEPT